MRLIKPKYCTVHGLDLGDGPYTWRYSQQHECLQEELGTPALAFVRAVCEVLGLVLDWS